MLNLDMPIDSLPETSVISMRRFRASDIETFWDLLNYFPSRYENFELVSPIGRVQAGETVTLKGQLVSIEQIYTKSRLQIQKATLKDNSGQIELSWYNQPYLVKRLKSKCFISVSGKIDTFLNHPLMHPVEYDLLDDLNKPTIHTGRLVPIYPEKNGLSTHLLREKIWSLLHLVDLSQCEYFPKNLLKANNLIGESSAYQHIHFPPGPQEAQAARERLGFDELFLRQLSSQLIRKQWSKETVGCAFKLTPHIQEKITHFIANLPFLLTSAQKRSVDELIQDLKKPSPMNRFLQGEVGSGKTVVAAVACYLACLNGFQTLFMAPTEILASQHYQTLIHLFTSHLTEAVKIALVTGSKKPKGSILKKSDIIIGTHALLAAKRQYEKVGLVVVDEQHRFGVQQRARLKAKGLSPHLLTMTATPIPRTVSLTLYGELDFSVLDEMPKGRLPVKTFLVPKEKRQAGYEWIKKQIHTHGIQVFIICPLIEESEIETMKTVRAATAEFDRLQKDIFPEFRLGLLHGRIKSKEKEKIMEDFKTRKIDILVSTPVVEVGIDFPNATIMIVEGAERFGLAQLHQLRGRVGRGEMQSYCFVYTENNDKQVVNRLRYFAMHQNGMELAEYDLKRRGPGDIYGIRQHGFSDLKIASFSDYPLIERTKQAVNEFLNTYSIDQFPRVQKRLEEYKIEQISRD